MITRLHTTGKDIDLQSETWYTVLHKKNLHHSHNSQLSPVLLGSTGGEGSESWHEEVETGEGHHVDGQFPQVGVELTGEPEAGGDTGHGGADQMVQVSVCGGGQLQGSVKEDIIHV